MACNSHMMDLFPPSSQYATASEFLGPVTGSLALPYFSEQNLVVSQFNCA